MAISCGSQIAVVVPRGSTLRSNSAGVTRLLSTWTWVSMNPGTAIRPRPVDRAHAAIGVVGADDPVAADRDVARLEPAGRDIENARALDHQVGRLAPERLIDPPAKLGPGERHA